MEEVCGTALGLVVGRGVSLAELYSWISAFVHVLDSNTAYHTDLLSLLITSELCSSSIRVAPGRPGWEDGVTTRTGPKQTQPKPKGNFKFLTGNLREVKYSF